MNIDYDDYYNLSEYVSRFTPEGDKYIALWLSQASVLGRIQLWEDGHGNIAFGSSFVPYYLERIEQDEVLDIVEVIEKLSLNCLLIEDGNVYGDSDIYYDFVGFLLMKGLVR